MGSTSSTYDSKGNLTLDPSNSNSYAYSSENLMTSASGSFSLAYDPGLRLTQVSGGTTVKFGFDGPDIVAEANSSNTIQRRYVFADETDEPILWYEGSGTSDRRWLHADERGSVIAVTDSSGSAAWINKYDEFGKPASGNVGRFQYTGQAWVPETNAYYYKARFFAPHLARFFQPDPIGYESGANLYVYVSNDPINFSDPSGFYPVCETIPGYTITNPEGDTIVGPKITCIENGQPLPFSDQLLVNTWRRLDFTRGDEGFFSVLPDRVIVNIPADTKTTCPGSGDVRYGLSKASEYKLEGGVPGHVHVQGFEPFIGPDDGVLAMRGGTTYMASPAGVYRINYNGNSRTFSVALLGGKWGASLSTIRNRMAAWNQFQGQSSRRPVGSGSQCTTTAL